MKWINYKGVKKMNPIYRPLVEKLMEFKNAKGCSLHVPGHKNGLLSTLPEGIRTALAYDVTELEGLDDLHEPTGIIFEAEQQLSAVYRTYKSFFLVNGSTVGNLAMVYATCKFGEPVIVQRNAHKSIFNAIELVGAVPIFVEPLWDQVTKTPTYMEKSTVEKALKLYPTATAVILTYPTYYGVTGNELEGIIKACHKKDIPVLVDEAHGAHFIIGMPFPKTSLQLGADIVVHSAHKTLPAMTMASFLHVNSTLIDKESVAYYLSILQSSSPSYLLMASLDDARAYVEAYDDEDIEYLLAKRKHLIVELEALQHIEIIHVDDPLKLLVRVRGLSGFKLQEQLDKQQVYVELADPDQVLFVLPLLKLGQSYPFTDIINALKMIVNDITNEVFIEQPTPDFHMPIISRPVYTKRKIQALSTNWVSYADAVGKIAAGTIIPYPPGIPLILVGEKITSQQIESLQLLFESKAHFQGVVRVAEQEIKVVENEVEAYDERSR